MIETLQKSILLKSLNLTEKHLIVIEVMHNKIINEKENFIMYNLFTNHSYN